jgi:hypothetical protein
MADLGFHVIVAEDACTELSAESHRAALLTFALTFGRVRPTGQIVELFGAAEARAEPDALHLTGGACRLSEVLAHRAPPAGEL